MAPMKRVNISTLILLAALGGVTGAFLETALAGAAGRLCFRR